MRSVKKTVVAGMLAAAVSTASAQGIPVIDIAAVIRMIEQITHQLTMIENQIVTLQSMSGSRGLGAVLRSPSYVPLDAPQQLDGVASNGYAGLTAPARAMRDADMVWNCQGINGPALAQCQAALAQPYQTKALLRQTIAVASQRIGQINGLLNAINGTQDQAAKLEIGARIQGEQALLQHEATRAQLLWMDAQNEQQRAEARRAEQTAEMLTRPLDARAALGGTAP